MPTMSRFVKEGSEEDDSDIDLGALRGRGESITW